MHRQYHTPLSRWMRDSGTTAPAVAEQLRVTRSAVYRWASGKGTPSALHLADLVALTGGRLSVADLARPEVQHDHDPA